MNLNSKNLKAIRPQDKLFKAFTSEVYDARTRDDFKLKQDFKEDYTIDAMDKGVETLNESVTK